jgi:hypothetical protein
MDTENVYEDPRHKRLSEQLSDASAKGNDDRTAELWQEMDSLRKVIRQERLDEFRAKAVHERDRELIELCRRQPVFEFEPEEPIKPDELLTEAAREAREKASDDYRKRLDVWQGELAEMLGGESREPDRMVSDTDRFAIDDGMIERNGRTVQIQYAELSHPVDAAPAVIRWLDVQGCTEIRYSFFCLD